MDEMTILLLHGFASSGRSTKARFFAEKFAPLPRIKFHALDFNPTPTDFEHMTVTGLVNRLRQYVLDHGLGDVYVIGSSMGSLVGLHYAHRFGGVNRMLLLAPALSYGMNETDAEHLRRWQEVGTAPVFHYAFEREVGLRFGFHVDGLQYRDPVVPPGPTMIIHGRSDDVIPIENSRRYAARFPHRVQLIEVDSDHRLNDQLPSIWTYVQSFLLA
jgi:pimeloyl-ACP methyl ester carboxylesterase